MGRAPCLIYPSDGRDATGLVVDLQHTGVELGVPLGDVDAHGDAGQKSFQGRVAVSPDDAVQGAGHPHVREIGRPLREDPFIGRLNVRVGPQHGGDAAVQIPPHGLFFAGGLGMHVDQDHRPRRTVGQAGEKFVRDLERTVDLGQVVPPHQGDDDEVRPLDGIPPHPLPAEEGGIVGGPQDARVRQKGFDLGPVPGVVSQREHVDAGFEEFLGHRGGQTAPAGRVLRVGQDTVDGLLRAEVGQKVGDRFSAGPPHDVSDEQDFHWMMSIQNIFIPSFRPPTGAGSRCRRTENARILSGSMQPSLGGQDGVHRHVVVGDRQVADDLFLESQPHGMEPGVAAQEPVVETSAGPQAAPLRRESPPRNDHEIDTRRGDEPARGTSRFPEAEPVQDEIGSFTVPEGERHFIGVDDGQGDLFAVVPRHPEERFGAHLVVGGDVGGDDLGPLVSRPFPDVFGHSTSALVSLSERDRQDLGLEEASVKDLQSADIQLRRRRSLLTAHRISAGPSRSCGGRTGVAGSVSHTPGPSVHRTVWGPACRTGRRDVPGNRADICIRRRVPGFWNPGSRRGDGSGLPGAVLVGSRLPPCGGRCRRRSIWVRWRHRPRLGPGGSCLRGAPTVPRPRRPRWPPGGPGGRRSRRLPTRR